MLVLRSISTLLAMTVFQLFMTAQVNAQQAAIQKQWMIALGKTVSVSAISDQLYDTTCVEFLPPRSSDSSTILHDRVLELFPTNTGKQNAEVVFNSLRQNEELVAIIENIKESVAYSVQRLHESEAEFPTACIDMLEKNNRLAKRNMEVLHARTQDLLEKFPDGVVVESF